jgi:hypothetical protein
MMRLPVAEIQDMVSGHEQMLTHKRRAEAAAA